jgi:hypothetical protein
LPTCAHRYEHLQPKADVALEVRTAADPASLTARLPRDIARVHPAYCVTDVTTQSALIDDTLVRELLLALISGFFATAALVLVEMGSTAC